MKKLPSGGAFMRGLACGLAVFACISVAKAHPYASQLTNTSGTISFMLNEAASTVNVTLTNKGTGQGTTISTGTSKGVQTFSLTQGATTYTNYSISVYKVGNGQITEISDDANTLNSLGGNLDGVAVNTNATDHNFGRIYMGKRLGGGFYVRNADQSDTLGQGSTAMTAGLGALLSGSSFNTARLFVGSDDSVYVGAGTTLANGCWLAALTPDLTTNQLVLAGTDPTIPAGQNHGGVIGTPVVTGSLAAGNLVVTAMDWEYPPGDSLQQWNIGAGPFPSSVPPTLLASTTQGAFQNVQDGFIAPNGIWMYTFLERGSHTTPGSYGSLQAFTVAGGNNIQWQSFANSITPNYDYFANCADCWISPDSKFLVMIDNGTAQLMFCSLDQNTGFPIESTLFTNVVGTPVATTGYGQVTFDAAQNIYQVANGNGLLKVFSQGLTTMAVTANDATTTNGTFNLSFPFPAISTSASIPVASQNTSPNGTGAGPAIPGQFTITRSGILTAPLTIFFTLGGTATNSEYTATAGSSTFTSTNGSGHLVTNSITIAAGQTSTNITITPVIDLVPRPLTTVALSVVTNVNYSLAVGGAAVVSIVNTAPQAVTVSGVQYPTMYKGLTNDFASFFITRLGDTNAPSYTVNNFTYSGTAVHGTDYTSVGRTVTNGTPGSVPLAIGGGVAINPGDTTVSATISPLQNVTGYVGNKTATIGVTAGSGYTVAGSATATMTIIDNAYPTAPLLFSDPLTAPTNSSGNDGAATWAITFANTNLPVVPDYTAAFGYNLADDGIGNAPSGATKALKVTVNKSGNAASAGVNCYPIGLNFSGNYAARFSMLLLEDEGIANATEFVTFGINHTGTATNWFAQDSASTAGLTYPAGIDGVWYAIDGAAGGTTAGDYWEMTGSGLASWGYVPLAVNPAGAGGTQNVGAFFYNSFTNAFKNLFDNIPGPYTTYSGVGSVYDSAGEVSDYISLNNPSANTWADVEIKQINNVVTMSINKTQIYSYTNTTLYANGTVDGTAYGSGPAHIPQSGTVMLGYDDPFASVGDVGAAYFSNLRVVQIGPLLINSIVLSGGNVVLTFTSEDGDDTTSSFSVLSSGASGGAANVDTAVSGVTFAQVPGSLTFTATFPQPATHATFYRIKHN